MKKERVKNPHGQYFTPRNVADLMVGMLSVDRADRILEPCSGAGVFLDALTDAGYGSVTGVEIDDVLAKHRSVDVINRSFVSYKPDQGFNAVIGNPPYIRWKDLSEKSKDEMQSHKLFGSLFNSLSDYLTVFIACSIELLEEGGELIFITPSFWMHTQHAQGLRSWMLERGEITEIVDFGEATVFEKVASAIIIFRFIKSKSSCQKIILHRYLGPRRVSTGRLDLADENQFRQLEIQSFTGRSHWALSTSEEMLLADALERDCALDDLIGTTSKEFSSLGDYVDIANGMVSGLDKAFRVPKKMHSSLTDKEQSAILPVLKAFDLEPWISFGVTDYIDIPAGLSEEEVLREYPNFYALLLNYKEILEERYSYKREIPFWEWSFRRSEVYFLTQSRKGFVPCKERLTNKETVRFSLTAQWAVATQDVTAFSPKPETKESIEYIVAFLSLLPITAWIRVRGLMKGGIAEFSERPLSAIPFRSINWLDENEMSKHDEITRLMRSLSSEADYKLDSIIDLVRKQFEDLLPTSTDYLSKH
jgi:adenine-specific DNA-methyltransferase